MPLLAIKLLTDPRAWIVLALIASHGFAFAQGDHYRQRRWMAAVEATNQRVAAANAKEAALAAKEEALRTTAFAEVQPVLAKTRCIATAELAAAFNRIR